MHTTRRKFLKLTAAGIASTVIVPSALAGNTVASTSSDESLLTDALFGFSAQEQARLAGLIQAGVLSMGSVLSIPAAASLRHLGWPVATQLSSGRVLIVYRRAPGHTDRDRSPQAGHYVIHSDDPTDWSSARPHRLGTLPGMHCVGHAELAGGGERLIVITSGHPRLVYTSDDQGTTWQIHESALDGLLNTAAHVGPNMISHPSFGLVVPFGQENNKGRRNFLIHTTDAGRTWQERIWLNRPEARGFEPTLATWGPGHMVMISREARQGFAVGPDGLYSHSQHVYHHRNGAPFNRVKFQTSRTNIVGNPSAGSSCHDTAEVIYNPVSKRIEVLQSHRWGGGPGKTGTTKAKDPDKEISSLNLWSIEPDALLAGSAIWQFDGTIIERVGYSRKGNRDGLHPGGSVIDMQRNMQHIYVYAGWRRCPSSLFRISRTLDTDRWRSATI